MSVSDAISRINNDTNRVNYERGRATLGNDKLDKQAFMQLLMAKLQNQDPLNPEDDAQFLSQQTQMAQLEKMDDLVKVLEGSSLLSQASTLVGKQVDVMDQFGNTHTGLIESASFENGTAGLLINGKNYTMNQVTKIYGSITPATPPA